MTSDDLPFDAAFLKKLEYLHIVSKRVFAGHFRAERRTKRAGSGIEFADHRGYAPGDDFRHIDWRAYQRLDKLLLRLFEEEQDLPIYLLIDASRSMADGRQSKLQYARQVAAALCYIGLAQLDRVTLAGYADRVVAEMPAQRGKARIFRVFRFLAGIQPQGETDARGAFRDFSTTHRSPGVAVVLSDFLDPAGFERGLDVLRGARHDVFAVHLTAKTDAEPRVGGDLVLIDSESGARLDVAITPALLAAYRAAVGRFAAELEAYCWRHQFGYLRTPIELPFEDAILQVFRQGRFLA